MIIEPQEKNSNEGSVNRIRQSKIKVMLVDDHQMMRNGLKKLINSQNDLEVVAEASDGTEVMKKVNDVIPDIIIMDVDMPVKNGIEATLDVHSQYPKMPVIGLSLHDNEEVANAMIKAGAKAYVSKTEAFDILCNTIRKFT